MKRDQIDGLVRYVAGKLQEKYGRLIGDDTHKFEGAARQVEGKLQRHGLRLPTSGKRGTKKW
jgi:uncharacterized protein YjbJ (UPF0337 family)